MEGGLELAYFAYILIQSPFESKFTNFRVAVISLLFVAMEITMLYYLDMTEKSQYSMSCEVAFIYLCGLTFSLGILFCVV